MDRPDGLHAGRTALHRISATGCYRCSRVQRIWWKLCNCAGHASAEMAVSDVVPEWLPEGIFSPRRLLSDEPLFLTEREGLWRVAVSLCRQVQSVNRQLSDELTLHAAANMLAPKIVDTQITSPPGDSRSTDGSEAKSLAAFDAFRKSLAKRPTSFCGLCDAGTWLRAQLFSLRAALGETVL